MFYLLKVKVVTVSGVTCIMKEASDRSYLLQEYNSIRGISHQTKILSSQEFLNNFTKMCDNLISNVLIFK